MELVYPGYRIVTFHAGNTSGWPVPADRVVDGLASRIGKLTGEDALEDEIVEAAKCALELVDEGFGAKRVKLAGGSYEFEVRDRGELQVDLDDGTLWLSPLDPGNDQHRDTLAAIGVTSYSLNPREVARDRGRS